MPCDGSLKHNALTSKRENLWIEWNYGRWVIDLDDPLGSKINSLQNRFLLGEHVHSLFDQYLVSVNPDVSILTRFIIYTHCKKDNYKIVVSMVERLIWCVGIRRILIVPLVSFCSSTFGSLCLRT